MALADLTNFNPWAQETAGQRQRGANLQNTLAAAGSTLGDVLARSKARRDRLQAQNQHFRDQEYALINKATDQLVQPQTNSNITDAQLQQTGQKIKQEYYDAVKTYQASDKGDEARAQFEQAKQKALGSARTIAGSLEKLTTATKVFEKAWETGGISDAMNPAVRQFMIDMVNPNTPPDQFQIVTDEESGQLKYRGETTNGDPVDFFLQDIANGDNMFAPIPNADMPGIVMNLTKGLKADMVQEARENGTIVSRTNWDALDVQLGARMDELLEDENMFRAIAAGEGFGWDAFSALKNGEGYVDPDDPEKVYNNFDDLKSELKEDLKGKIESILPHKEEVIFDPQTGGAPKSLLQERQELISGEQALQTQQDINSVISNVARDPKGSLDTIKNSFVGRVKGVDNVKEQDGKIVLLSGFGKDSKVQHVFDMNSLADRQRMSEMMGGKASLYNQAEQRNQAGLTNLFESNKF